ncbi:MAG: sensor histidine kinase [Gemmatimonadaceae bacterium]|nr:sensor histidine kinase [Gloeobacterales cyanobacterium ES-bin-141]
MQARLTSLKKWLAGCPAIIIPYPSLFLGVEWALLGAVSVAQLVSPRLPWTIWTTGLTVLTIGGLAVLSRPPVKAHNGLRVLYLLASITLAFAAVSLFRPLMSVFLYVAIALKSRFLLGRQGLLWTSVLILSTFLANVLLASHFGWLEVPAPLTVSTVVFNGTLVVLVGVAGALAVVDALAAERTIRLRAEKLAAELAEANQLLVAGARQAEELATAQERNRIAREIHDSLGHCLTALNVQLEASLKLAGRDPERSHHALAQAKRLGSEALKEVRHSVRALRPVPEGQPLGEALLRLAGEFEQTTTIPVVLQNHPAPNLTPAQSDALFRIAQEGLTNVARHSHAQRVWLSLLPVEGGWQMVLKDDGVGFDAAQKLGGYGLWSIRERVHALAGTTSIETIPGEGCRLQVWLPVQVGPHE